LVMFSPEDFAASLEAEIRDLPAGFYDTFQYTRTGNNLAHPITIGVICRLLLKRDSGLRLALDLRLNEGHLKFQPDIAVLSPHLDPLLYVDYESPNSSDARVPSKDIEAYSSWVAGYHDAAPYFVITSLPDKPVPSWELRHTGKGQSNAEFAGPHRAAIHAEMRANPYRFWVRYYRSKVCRPLPSSISFLNIDGKNAQLLDLS